jgi:anti-sigma factor RsiW
MNRAHLSDPELIESYLLSTVDEHHHVASCADCRVRYEELAATFDDLHDAADAEADAVFTPERLYGQRERILRRLERQGHSADVLRFPNRFAARGPRRLLGPARRWIAGAAVAGLVAGVFVGFAVDRRVSAPGVVAPVIDRAVLTQPAAPATVSVISSQDDQVLSDIEDALTSAAGRVVPLRTLDAMTTPPDYQEASLVSQ